MNDIVATSMAQLAEPSPPASFKAAVMARIAREAEQQSQAAAEATNPSRRRRESPAWLWTLTGGVGVVLAASIYGWIGAGALPDLTSPLIGRGRPELIPMEGPIALAIAFGLLAYVAGLFAPLRSTPHPSGRAWPESR